METQASAPRPEAAAPVSPAGSSPGFARAAWPAALGLLATLALFEFTDLDLALQDRFFDFSTGAWAIDKNAALPRLLFYDGPKVLIILLAVALAAWALGPARWRRRPRWRRVDVLVVIATLATGPALISLGKATTNVFCPYQVDRYGGDVPYNKLTEPWPEGKKPKKRGRGFPAGHASGGYALMSLAGLGATRRGRRVGLAIGLFAGTWMGAYQMLRGAHYLSHTIVSALVCWLVFLFWRKVLRADLA